MNLLDSSGNDTDSKITLIECTIADIKQPYLKNRVTENNLKKIDKIFDNLISKCNDKRKEAKKKVTK